MDPNYTPPEKAVMAKAAPPRPALPKAPSGFKLATGKPPGHKVKGYLSRRNARTGEAVPLTVPASRKAHFAAMDAALDRNRARKARWRG